MVSQMSVKQESKKSPYLNPWFWAFMLILLVAPFYLRGYQTFQLTLILIYAVAIMGLSILTGFSGQFSLGHVAFFALGAYTSGLLMDNNIMAYPLTIFVAAVVCFVFGFIFGLPALRLHGIYLALATFALSVATPQILKLSPLIPWTGGVNGISLMKPETPFDLPLSQDQWLYFFVLVFTLVMWWAATKMANSRSGRALLAIRENPIAAGAMGINVALYKSLAFGISGLYAGVAGSLSAIVVQYVSPDSFTLNMSIAFFVGMVLGGASWLPGAFFGGAFIVVMPQLAASFSKGSEGVVYGILLILLIFVLPSGLSGIVQKEGFRFGRSQLLALSGALQKKKVP